MPQAVPPPRVQNIVINALLESLYDILDRDGKLSILRAAGRPDLMDAPLNPQGFSDYSVFLQIVDTMNDLLRFSDYIAYEIGRKFAIYSDPSGTGIETLVNRLKEWIQVDWQIELISSHPKSPILVLHVVNCPFCGSHKGSSLNGGVSCDFLRGVFSMSCEKTSRQAVACTEINHIFSLTMKPCGGK